MGFLATVAFTIAIAFVVSRWFPMILNFIRKYWSAPEQDTGKHSPSGGGDFDAVVKAGGDSNGDPDQGEQSTPKARPSQPATDVPAFTIESEDQQLNQSLPLNVSSAEQRTTRSVRDEQRMAPSPQVSANHSQPKTSSGLMLPPARPNIVPNRNPAASLRVPSTGPLPNRGPPVNSQQRVSQSLGIPGTVQTPNARGKVLLSPGHSPMDWAALTRTSRLSGVDTFQRVTPSELRRMTGRKGKPAWSSWQHKVYNITPYLPFHPGGEAELMKAAGRDGTALFMDVHPWVNWENMLESCLVGVMVPEDYGKGEGSSLEDMD